RSLGLPLRSPARGADAGRALAVDARDGLVDLGSQESAAGPVEPRAIQSGQAAPASAHAAPPSPPHGAVVPRRGVARGMAADHFGHMIVMSIIFSSPFLPSASV